MIVFVLYKKNAQQRLQIHNWLALNYECVQRTACCDFWLPMALISSLHKHQRTIKWTHTIRCIYGRRFDTGIPESDSMFCGQMHRTYYNAMRMVVANVGRRCDDIGTFGSTHTHTLAPVTGRLRNVRFAGDDQLPLQTGNETIVADNYAARRLCIAHNCEYNTSDISTHVGDTGCRCWMHSMVYSVRCWKW